ncbi:acyltransferase family protein [Psychroserpens sp.]|uniref:acyltransferase family protein n=1 Tax=Psychroserpens sp. TaxID=2020870 RepID=UPI0039E36AE7
MNKRFEALDAFRGICALSVVIFHMKFLDSFTEITYFRGSAILVDFFFVLSGFVLSHGYAFKVDSSFFSFMRSRFYRLYPLHFVMFLFFFVMQIVKLVAYKFGVTFNVAPFSGVNDISEIIPNLLLLQSWTPFTEATSYNFPSWSISIEFYLYALLYVTISFFKGIKLFIWALISFFSFILIYRQSDLLTAEVLRGLSCFFGGACTYMVYNKIYNYKPNFIFGTVFELCLLVLIVILVHSTFSYREIIAPLLFIVTVLFFSYESGECSRLLKFKPFQYLGKLSYSLYMTHAGVLLCVGIFAIFLEKTFNYQVRVKVNEDYYLSFGHAVVNNIVAIIIIIVVILLSVFTHKYIEIKGVKLNKANKFK